MSRDRDNRVDEGQDWSYCRVTRKRRFRSRRLARRSNRRNGKRLRVYPCRSCGGWHVTTQRVPGE